jgi:hypothetical protein
MAVWIRVAATSAQFEQVRSVLDRHLARETTGCPVAWTETNLPLAWAQRISQRWAKRWRSQSRAVVPSAADSALVERLERALDLVARGVGRDMVVSRRRVADDDWLVVLDVSAEEGTSR